MIAIRYDHPGMFHGNVIHVTYFVLVNIVVAVTAYLCHNYNVHRA